MDSVTVLFLIGCAVIGGLAAHKLFGYPVYAIDDAVDDAVDDTGAYIPPVEVTPVQEEEVEKYFIPLKEKTLPKTKKKSAKKISGIEKKKSSKKNYKKKTDEEYYEDLF